MEDREVVKDIGYFRMITSPFGDNARAAADQTIEYLTKNEKLSEKLDLISHVVNQTYPQAVPSDFDSLGKIGFFPFTEASTDFIYSLSWVYQGCYKSSYHHLRASFELWLIGLYFLSSSVSGDMAREWLDSEAGTPFFSQVIKSFFQEKYYIEADREFGYRKMITDFYYKLCDFVHCRGQEASHGKINLANFPRFVPESFANYVQNASICLELTSIAFALRYPILLTGLPMFDKFGFNPPMSGFLDQVEALKFRDTIKPNQLQFLDRIADQDQYTQNLKEFVLSRPDLSFEELERQSEEWEKEFGDQLLDKKS